MDLPVICGPVRVTFKNEGEERGMIVGPVTVIDATKFEAWARSTGQVRHTTWQRVDSNAYGSQAYQCGFCGREFAAAEPDFPRYTCPDDECPSYEDGPRPAVMWKFGETPDGMHDLGWFTKRDALRVAKHYGVELGEA